MTPDLPPDEILNAIITTGIDPSEVRSVRVEWLTNTQARIWITLRDPPPHTDQPDAPDPDDPTDTPHDGQQRG